MILDSSITFDHLQGSLGDIMRTKAVLFGLLNGYSLFVEDQASSVDSQRPAATTETPLTLSSCLKFCTS
jgi:hypothetical protein